MAVNQQLLNCDAILAQLRQHLHCAQQLMKAQADGKQREVSFQVGDLVFLKLRPYRQKTMAHRSNQKLSPRFYGPFRISDKVGHVAYRLQLPNTTQIHPIFHVSQLKQAIGYSTPLLQLPPQLNDNLEMIVEPKTILGTRHISNGLEVLIKWQGLPNHEASWEPLEVIQHQFPTFHIEDKVFLPLEGIDKPPNLIYIC